MTISIISPAPTGTTEAVNVHGVIVSRRGRCGWHIAHADLMTIWERIKAEHPTQDDEKVISTCFPALNLTLMTTKPQRQAYMQAINKLTRAARRATQPKRDARRSAKREAQQHYFDMMVKTAFAGGTQ